jgi:NADH-quinone oxidoreductase subunit M
VIGVVNIVYGALCAMAQTDYKKLIAYSSVSHMGYVMLGMAAFTQAGINGAVLQMFNHGTITAMLFILVGVIYDRAHTREINAFGGLASQMPVYAALTGFAFFAAMGLPGLSAFISEILVLIGAWQRKIQGPAGPHAARSLHAGAARDHRAHPRRLSARDTRPAGRLAQPRQPGRADGACACGRDGALSGPRALVN